MLDDPSYIISQGTLCFAYESKNNGGFHRSSNVSREKQNIILKKEQEMAVKELLTGKYVMAILPTGFGKRTPKFRAFA